MRLIVFIMFLGLMAVRGAVPVDAVLHWEGSAQGALNQTKLNAGTFGYTDTSAWSSYSGSRFTLVAGENYTFPASVTVSNQTFTGSGTNWMRNNAGDGGADDSIEFRLPGYADSTITNVAICGFVKFSITNSSASSMSLDLIYLESTYGGFSIQQWDGISGTASIRAHSATGSSTFGDGISITGGKVYYHQTIRRPNQSVTTLRVYDPDNSFTLVGSSECATSDDNTYHILWKSGYIGDPPGEVLFGDQVILYNPTDATLSNLVTVASSRSATAVTARVGNVTFK